MAHQQFWIRTPGGVVGPVSPRTLREYAAQGQIGPATLVSSDQVRWIQAGRFEGLFTPPPATPPRPADVPPPAPTRPRPSDAAPPTDGGRSGPLRPVVTSAAPPPPPPGDGRLALPVIRIRRRFSGYGIIAIYKRHIMIGDCYRPDLQITEEMCHASGETQLSNLLWNVRRVKFVDVEYVTEETPKKRKTRCFSRASSSSMNSRFRVMIRGHRPLIMKFDLRRDQSTNVRKALALALGDRYLVRYKKRFWQTIPLLLVLLSFFFAAIGTAQRDRSGGIRWAILAVAAFTMLFAFRCAFATRGEWSPLDADWPDGPSEPNPPPKRRARTRAPFRSRPLGWAIKLLGLVYWLVIMSPLASSLTSPIQELMELNLKNQTQAQQYIWAAIMAPGPLLILAGYRMQQERYEPARNDDTRKPILFLRPFEDDAQTTLQPPGMLAGMAGLRADATTLNQRVGSKGRTLSRRWGLQSLTLNLNPIRIVRIFFGYGVGSSEETLVRFFEKQGPVIAIGKPGERLASPGSRRMYVDDDHWQNVILGELSRAQAVVIQPGSSGGIRWELEQVYARVEPYRVLLCLVSYWNDPQAYEDLAAIIRQVFGVDVPRVIPFLERPAFLYFDRGWVPRLQQLSDKNPAAWPVTGNAADLEYTLRPFLQGMHGGDREPPRPPRWRKGLCRSASLAVAFPLATIVALLPIIAIEFSAVSFNLLVKANLHVHAQDYISQIPIVVAQSARIHLDGHAVPYRLQIPEALGKLVSTEDFIEHWRQSPDRVLALRVIAYSDIEDVTTIAQQRLDSLITEGFKPNLILTRTLTREGVDWTESRISFPMSNGLQVLEITRAASGPEGTVAVLLTLTGNPEVHPAYGPLAEEILDSVQVTRPTPLAPSRPPTPPIEAPAPPPIEVMPPPPPIEPAPVPKRGGLPKNLLNPPDRLRGSDVQGPLWDQVRPEGAHQLGADRIRTTFGRFNVGPEDGRSVPDWAEVQRIASPHTGKLHVTGDSFCYTLLEPRNLLLLKFENLDQNWIGFAVVYRSPDGDFFYSVNGDDPDWKALEEGQSRSLSWNEGQGRRVVIEIARPNENQDDQGREIDYRFRLVED